MTDDWITRLLIAGTGAIIAFVLTQGVNIKWIYRPKLTIVPVGNDSVFLSQTEPLTPAGEEGTTIYYGFRVRNSGKSIATNVRCQLVKVEVRDRGCRKRAI